MCGNKVKEYQNDILFISLWRERKVRQNCTVGQLEEIEELVFWKETEGCDYVNMLDNIHFCFIDTYILFAQFRTREFPHFSFWTETQHIKYFCNFHCHCRQTVNNLY